MGDTIAAISTAMTSSSGIGIVRMSGDEAVKIADKVFRGVKSGSLADMASHTIHYGYIYDGDILIDEVLLMLMKAPSTYTREDVVEIDCHGGILVLRTVLDILIRNGARPAEPGEFTKRAFLNGRIDLSQAEAVMDIISSKSRAALESSARELGGSIRKKIENIRKQILHDSSWIEASLDDPEHIDAGDIIPVIRKNVIQLLGTLDDLKKSYRNGRILKEGIRTAIIGKPNAGKSSLMNVLLGQDRAIVTDIAGTTRDILEEQANIEGIPLIISDTAGIRKTDDIIEKIGVDRARGSAESADLIIYVADSSVKLDQNDLEIMKMIKGRNVIALLNKSDLEQVTSETDIRKYTDAPVIAVSAKEETGMDEFYSELKKMFFSGDITFNDEIFITNSRHLSAIEGAITSLSMVIESIDSGMPEDMLTIDLMDAYGQLGLITGESVGEDLIDSIFSEFCMGK